MFSNVMHRALKFCTEFRVRFCRVGGGGSASVWINMSILSLESESNAGISKSYPDTAMLFFDWPFCSYMIFIWLAGAWQAPSELYGEPTWFLPDTGWVNYTMGRILFSPPHFGHILISSTNVNPCRSCSSNCTGCTESPSVNLNLRFGIACRCRTYVLL